MGAFVDVDAGTHQVAHVAEGAEVPRFAGLHDLLGRGAVQPVDGGHQHVDVGGVQVDWGAHGQQRHMGGERRHRGRGQPQPPQLGHAGRQQGGGAAVGACTRLCAAQAVDQGTQLLAGQAQALEQPGELPQRHGLHLPAFCEVGDVQATLQVGDLAREEGLGGVGARVVHLRHVLVGREEGGQAGLLQGDGPGLGQVVGSAGAPILAQDQPRPVERADQDPRGLHAAALGRFDLHRAPLLPHRGRRKGSDQRDGEHGGEQRRTARLVPVQWTLPQRVPPWSWLCQATGGVPLGGCGAAAQGGTHDLPPPSTGLTQSRVSWPVSAWPGGRVICRRMPSGVAEVLSPVGVPVLDCGLDHAPPR